MSDPKALLSLCTLGFLDTHSKFHVGGGIAQRQHPQRPARKADLTDAVPQLRLPHSGDV